MLYPFVLWHHVKAPLLVLKGQCSGQSSDDHQSAISTFANPSDRDTSERNSTHDTTYYIPHRESASCSIQSLYRGLIWTMYLTIHHVCTVGKQYLFDFIHNYFEKKKISNRNFHIITAKNIDNEYNVCIGYYYVYSLRY